MVSSVGPAAWAGGRLARAGAAPVTKAAPRKWRLSMRECGVGGKSTIIAVVLTLVIDDGFVCRRRAIASDPVRRRPACLDAPAATALVQCRSDGAPDCRDC